MELENQVKKLEDQLKKLQSTQPKNQISIIVFSGDLDKVLASMIIATGARAMDYRSKNVLHILGEPCCAIRTNRPKAKISCQKLFGFMLPKAH